MFFSLDGEHTEVQADIEGFDVGCGVELRGFCLAHVLTQTTATQSDGHPIWRFNWSYVPLAEVIRLAIDFHPRRTSSQLSKSKLVSQIMHSVFGAV